MPNNFAYMEKIRNESEYLDTTERLRVVYREIVQLIIKKEEYEKRIEEYLKARKGF